MNCGWRIRGMSFVKLAGVVLLLLSAAETSFGQKMPRESVIDLPAVGEGLSVHNLFQSNMVIQRDKPFSIWGWAQEGAEVKVRIQGASQSVTAKGRAWKVEFPAMKVSATPLEIIVMSGDETRTLENVLVGDVWVLGGQSNMEFPLSKVENGNLEIVSANYPEIRILTMPVGAQAEMKESFARLHEWSSWSGRHFRKGDWDVCSPEIARELSAIGYVFARRVHMASRVPIGVIDVSRGGTTVETWTPDSVLRLMEDETVKTLLSEWDQKVSDWDPKVDLENRVKRHHQWVERMTKEGRQIPANRTVPTDLKPGPAFDANRPGNCFAGMMGPIRGLAVKGAIFHQGYNNCFKGSEGAKMYRAIFPKMISAWREAFGDPEMPFGILSLCTDATKQTLTNYTEMMANAGPFIREAQYQTYLELKKAGDENVGFVSTYDLRRRWYHPQLKAPAGERAARWALATEYGLEKDIRWKPPELAGMAVEEGSIILTMDEPVNGVDDGGVFEGFAIAGEDRKFYPAKAEHFMKGKDGRGRPQKDNMRIVLTSPLVLKPVHFRYAWGRNPMGNLQANGNTDIPFATQRSDDWLMEEVWVVNAEGEKTLERFDGRKLRAVLKSQDQIRLKKEAKLFLRAE